MKEKEIEKILLGMKDGRISKEQGLAILKQLRSNTKQSSDIYYFRSTWKQQNREKRNQAFEKVHLLLLDTDEVLYEELCKSGVDVQLGIKGKTYQQIGSLLNSIHISNKKINTIIINSAKKQMDIHNQFVEELPYDVFELLKSILTMKMELNSVVILHDKSLGMQQPCISALSSLAPSMNMLAPELTIKTIQIALEEKYPCEDIIEELTVSYNKNQEVSYQKQGRFIKVEEEITWEQVGEKRWKKNGTYLITGGMGKLGYVLAQYLAKKYHANLILVGRRIKNSQIEEQIQCLERYGAQVAYHSADSASQIEMKRVLEKGKQQFGTINGVFHVAGITSQQDILSKNIEQMKDIIYPKVEGLKVLDTITKEEPLDFFVMYSSTAAVLGDLGICDYGYANKCLSDYAEYRNDLVKEGQRSGFTVAIQWPMWRNGGMHFDAESEKLYFMSSGLQYLEDEDGMHIIEQVLSGQEDQLAVMKGDVEKIRKSILKPIKIEKVEPVVNTVDLKKALRVDLAKLASFILKMDVEEIQYDQNFAEYGFDSLTLKEFADQTNDLLGVTISPTVYFSHSNIESLTSYLLEENKEQIRTHYADTMVKTEENRIEDDKKENIEVENSEIENGKKENEKIESQSVTLKMNDVEESIAVIGMDGIFPQSESLEDFWNNLVTKKELVTEIPRERWDWRKYYSEEKDAPNKTNAKWGAFILDADKFDAEFFHITPREAELIDPQQRLFLQTAWKAIEDAGYNVDELAKASIGVFTGVQFSDYQQLIFSNLKEGKAHIGTGNATTMLANRVSYFMDLTGPSETVDTACSSSLVAINRAVKSILAKECEMAIAGGVSLMISPRTYLGAAKLGVLSPEGKCKTFSKGANGYVKGEGVGAILLKPLSKAIADKDNIYGVIRACKENHGGHANSITAPNSEAQAKLIASAYQACNVKPSEISYIEAHGTGTELGDPIEIEGIKQAFLMLQQNYAEDTLSYNYCGVGSVKTNVGHLEPAAGIVSIIKVLLAMKYKTLPGLKNMETQNPYIKLEHSPLYLVEQTQEWKRLKTKDGEEIPRIAGISSFGFGGSNVHLVLEEYVDEHKAKIDTSKTTTSKEHVIVLSAKDQEQLKVYVKDMIHFVDTQLNTNGNQSYWNQLKQIIADVIHISVDQMGMQDSLDEITTSLYDYDCIAHEMEATFGISMNADELRRLNEIQKIVAYITERKGIAKNLGETISLWDMAYTLHVGRQEMNVRLAFTARTYEELKMKLNQFLNGGAADIYSNAIKGKNIDLEEIEDIEHKSSSEIARLWTLGYKVNWSKIEEKGNRVSIPTYPFKKERYWIGSADRIKVIESEDESTVKNKWLHPFVQENTSEITKFQYSTNRKQCEELLDICKIKNYSVCSNTVLLEIATVISKKILHYTKCKMKHILWYQPMVLDAVEQYDIVLQQDGNIVVCEIRSKDVLYAQVELEEDNSTIGDRMVLEELKADTIRQVSKEAFYQKLAFRYPIQYQVVETAYLGKQSILLSIQPERKEEIFLNHLSVMEAAIQGVLFLEKEINNQAIRLIRKIQMTKFDSNLEDGRYLYISSGEVKFLDCFGQVIGYLKGIETEECLDGEESNIENGTEEDWILQKSFIKDSKVIDSVEGKNIIVIVPEEYQNEELAGNSSVMAFQNYFYFVTVRELMQGTDSLPTGDKVQAYVDLCDLYGTEEALPEQRIEFLQEIIRNMNGEALTLLHITNGLHTFQCTKPSLQGAKIAMLYKMLGAEYKAITARTIDVDAMGSTLQQVLKIALNELSRLEPNSEICYRGMERYIPTMTKSKIETISEKKTSDYQGKTIILTGATGGIGSRIVREYVKQGATHFIFIERTDLPRREQWEAIKNSTHKKQIQKVELLQFLMERGCQVDVYSEGLKNRRALEAFMSTHVKGTIGGVIHCAGVSIETNPAFKSKSMQDIKQTLEPKIDGLVNLFEVVKDRNPQCFVVFSSISAMLPSLAVGASDYALANSYMDYFVEYQNAKGYTFMKSINWPRWNDVGMQGIESPIYKALGFKSITSEYGIRILFDLMQDSEKKVVLPAKVDAEKVNLETIFFTRMKQEHVEESKVDKKAVVSVSVEEDEVTDIVRNVFHNELKMDKSKLGGDIRFEEFGVDSIVIAELVVQLEKEIHMSVEPSVLIEYSTINELAAYIRKQMGVKLDKQPVLEETVFTPIQPKEADKKQTSLYFKQKIQERQLVRNRQAQQATQQGSGKIAVIGMGCNFPKAKTKQEYWNNIANKVDCVVEIPKSRWDIEKYYSPEPKEGKSISKWGAVIGDYRYFDAEYFKINENDAKQYDPLIRLVLEESAQTICDAGYEKKEISGKKVGVFIGARTGGFASKLTGLSKNSVTGIGQNFIAAHVAHFFNLKGPNMVVDSACSSSLVSLHLACQSILTNESEMALAGGVDVIYDEKTYVLMSEAKALSPDGRCYTFDERANGFVPGEGCGMVLLKRLEKAMEDGDQIYAVIDSSAVNNDGHTMGITTPNPEAQHDVILNALEKGNIDARSIGYVETHGTGTMIGDPIELKALTKVFKKYTEECSFCGVGSIKSNMGHLMSAAGVASFIKVVLALENKLIPPTIHCERPNPRFEFDSSPFYVATNLKAWEKQNGVRRAGISSFGFGGTNAHVIVSEFEEKESYQPIRKSKQPIEFHKKYLWNEPLEMDEGEEKEEAVENTILKIDFSMDKDSNPFLS